MIEVDVHGEPIGDAQNVNVEGQEDSFESWPENIRPASGAGAAKGQRRYCFTCNWYKLYDNGEAIFPVLAREEKRIIYFICGEERGTQSGIEHLQGYFELKSPATMVQIQSWPAFSGQGTVVADS